MCQTFCCCWFAVQSVPGCSLIETRLLSCKQARQVGKAAQPGLAVRLHLYTRRHLSNALLDTSQRPCCVRAFEGSTSCRAGQCLSPARHDKTLRREGARRPWRQRVPSILRACPTAVQEGIAVARGRYIPRVAAAWARKTHAVVQPTCACCGCYGRAPSASSASSLASSQCWFAQ